MEIGLDLDKNVGLDLNREKNLFCKIIGETLDKTANFAIKMMPVPDSVKDVLRDVKDAVKTGDLGKVISTAVSSSIREVSEFIGISSDKMQDLNELKNLMLRGGLRQCLSAGIETAYSSYINGNILGDEIRNFIKSYTNNIESRNFINQIDSKLEPYIKIRNDIDSLCEKWYKSYDRMDIKELNAINSDINFLKTKGILTDKQLKEVKVVKNLTEFVNSKKDKLTELELSFCNNV